MGEIPCRTHSCCLAAGFPHGPEIIGRSHWKGHEYLAGFVCERDPITPPALAPLMLRGARGRARDRAPLGVRACVAEPGHFVRRVKAVHFKLDSGVELGMKRRGRLPLSHEMEEGGERRHGPTSEFGMNPAQALPLGVPGPLAVHSDCRVPVRGRKRSCIGRARCRSRSCK